MEKGQLGEEDRGMIKPDRGVPDALTPAVDDDAEKDDALSSSTLKKTRPETRDDDEQEMDAEV